MVEKMEFNEVLRARWADRVLAEMRRLTDILGQTVADAVFEGEDPATKIRTNVDQFRAAALAAIEELSSELTDAQGKVGAAPSDEDLQKMLITTCTHYLQKKGVTKMAGTTYRTHPFAKRGDVLAVVDAAASEIRKREPEKFAGMVEHNAQAAARALVWKQHGELADAYQSLPAEDGAGVAMDKADASTSAQTAGTAGRSSAPVEEGAEVLRVLDEISSKAYELIRTGKFSSLPLARAEAWRLNPDLRERYERANAG